MYICNCGNEVTCNVESGENSTVCTQPFSLGFHKTGHTDVFIQRTVCGQEAGAWDGCGRKRLFLSRKCCEPT